jgi:hypothetical protein
MSGFPLADSAYYEMPGSIMAGWLALQLTGELQSRTPNLSRGSIHFAPPSTECASLTSLVERLRREHETHYWYRGQIATRTCLYEGRIESLAQAFPNLEHVRISFDGLIPSAFRSVTSSKPASWNESGIRLRPALDHFSGALRSILRSRSDALKEVALSFFREAPLVALLPLLAMGSVKLSKNLPEFHPGTNVLRSYLRLIALAQHYEHGSAMVDVTRSPDVAAWFASHRWNDGQPTRTMDGVGLIYRFNRHALERMISDRLLWAENGPPGIQGLGLFGIVDISSFGRDIAARPSAQLGGSVLGLENSAMYFLMGAYSVGEVFTFPHASVTGAEVSLSRADLCPVDDPAIHILRKDGEDQAIIAPEELGALLSTAGMSRSEVNHLVKLREAELL